MELLYNQGGIYMDIDTISVRPYHHLLEHQCVLGYQDNPEGLVTVMMCQPKCLFLKNGYLFINRNISLQTRTPGWDTPV